MLRNGKRKCPKSLLRDDCQQPIAADDPLRGTPLNRGARARRAQSQRSNCLEPAVLTPVWVCPASVDTGENGSQLSVLTPVRAGNTPLWFLLDSGNIRGTLVARQLALDGSIEINQDGTALLAVGRRTSQRLSVISDDINYDGVLGTEYLQTNVVSIDLRGVP